jgi:hypothetical protein
MNQPRPAAAGSCSKDLSSGPILSSSPFSVSRIVLQFESEIGAGTDSEKAKSCYIERRDRSIYRHLKDKHKTKGDRPSQHLKPIDSDTLSVVTDNIHIHVNTYYTRSTAMATPITIFARESLTSNREDGSAVRYSTYFTRLRIEYNDAVSRLKKVYAKSEVW